MTLNRQRLPCGRADFLFVISNSYSYSICSLSVFTHGTHICQSCCGAKSRIDYEDCADMARERPSYAYAKRELAKRLGKTNHQVVAPKTSNELADVATEHVR